MSKMQLVTLFGSLFVSLTLLAKSIAGYTYFVTVQTSEVFSAGTNANVFITLYGEVANSQEILLSENAIDPFQRNSSDNFNITTNNWLGDLSLCHIRHDNTGFAPGWLLSSITVSDFTTGKFYYYDFDQWIDLAANASASFVGCLNNKIGQRCVLECNCQEADGYKYACNNNGSCSALNVSCLPGWSGKTCHKKKLNTSIQVFTQVGTSADLTDGIRNTYADFYCNSMYILGVKRISVQTRNQMIVECLANTFYQNIRTYICSSNSVTLYQNGSVPGAACVYIDFNGRGTYLQIINVYGNVQYMSLKCYAYGSARTYLRIYGLEVYECSEGTFGEDCSQICDYCIKQNCNGTGHCLDGCVTGATEAGCTQCPPNCNCNRNTGICVSCKTGFYGELCQWRCHRNCRNFQCDKITGRCMACITTRSYYGDMCQNMCPQNCDYNGCHRDLGTCNKCRHGYHGAYCSEYCPINCVMCTNQTVCTECEASWVGDLCDCKKDETTGQCNMQVQQPMTSTSTQQTCNVVNCKECSINTTSCKTCVNGFHGSNCDVLCSSGCVEYSCNRTTAECLWGCNQGWDGPKCDQAMNVQDETKEAVIILGSAVGVAMLALISITIFIVLILVRKKRRQNASSYETVVPTRTQPNNTEHTYQGLNRPNIYRNDVFVEEATSEHSYEMADNNENTGEQ